MARIDKHCEDCGVLIPNAYHNTKTCGACAYQRNRTRVKEWQDTNKDAMRRYARESYHRRKADERTEQLDRASGIRAVVPGGGADD